MKNTASASSKVMTIVVFPFFLNCGQMPGGTDWENKTKGSTIRKFQVILDQSTAERVIVTEISATIELRRHHKRSTGNRVAIRRNRGPMAYYNNSMSHSEHSDSHYESSKEGHANTNPYRKIRDIEKNYIRI